MLLGGFQSLSYAWLALLLVPLVIFYFLKLKRPRLEIPSLALWRQVTGVTQEARRAWRQAQIQATAEDVRAAALDMVRQAAGRTGTAVLSSRARLRVAAASLPGALTVEPLAPRAPSSHPSAS